MLKDSRAIYCATYDQERVVRSPQDSILSHRVLDLTFLNDDFLFKNLDCI